MTFAPWCALIIWLGLAFAERSLAAKLMVYQVLKVSGVVLTRTPTGASWYRLSTGDQLFEGQLVQVTNGASVTLEEDTGGFGGGIAKDRTQITLAQPIVARLSSDLLREVKVNSVFVEKLTNQRLPTRSFDEVQLSLGDAWEKMTTVFSGPSSRANLQIDLNALEKEGIAIGVSSKKLKLLTPVMNTVTQSADWPAELKMVWLKPERGDDLRTYHVYVWPVGTVRSSRVGQTRQEFYTIKLKAPGAYFVQITSDDGKWQSPAHAVHAVGTAEPKELQTSGPTKILSTSEELSPESPPDYYISVSKNVSTPITFVWNLKAPADSDEVELQIFNANTGQALKRIKSRAHHAVVPLSPGRYRWHVGIKAQNLRSVDRSFEVVDPRFSGSSSDRRALLRRLLESGKNATVALEDGI